MTKPKRYAVAIDATGAVILCETMTGCAAGTPETWHPGTGQTVPSWANVWAADEQEAKGKAVAMWMRAALLALAERMERPMTGMSNLDVARQLRRIAG